MATAGEHIFYKPVVIRGIGLSVVCGPQTYGERLLINLHYLSRFMIWEGLKKIVHLCYRDHFFSFRNLLTWDFRFFLYTAEVCFRFYDKINFFHVFFVIYRAQIHSVHKICILILKDISIIKITLSPESNT